jgi:hypothetical protein
MEGVGGPLASDAILAGHAPAETAPDPLHTVTLLT